ncbi:DUF5709 domain-containing protein [Georgenia sp. SYP-B2076]|uniref:DUF5709 domain-containing protein n=1 Tax=Georgenia sp. SYP-B2076 TaxID=2495881 RepID=UPI000F8E2D2A|nr:DUF5709 domain-containing protein [Georgenia sp. SYP-B2076]
MSTESTEGVPSTEGSPGSDQFLADESWQPSEEDMLLDNPSDDVLDEGLTAPDDDPLAGVDLTESGQREGDTIAERVAREEPEVWEERPADDSPHAGPGTGGEPAPDGVDETSVGRLVAEPDDDDPSDTPGEMQDVLASDVGLDGARFMPEEAAMHLTDTEDVAVDEGGTIDPDDRP